MNDRTPNNLGIKVDPTCALDVNSVLRVYDIEGSVRAVSITAPEYNVISSGVPYYKQEDGYIVYLEEIYPDHRALLESDKNVFIEE